MIVKPDGPIPARILLVGEAPGHEEELKGVPFVGASGQELNRILHEAGIMRSECFVTNVCRVRPEGNRIENFIAMKKKDITPAHILLKDKYVLKPIIDGYEMLRHEIETVKPNVIIAFGNTALWALTGRMGIKKWRGSMLRYDGGLISSGLQPKVIPAYHPAAILRQWELRAITVQDIRRAAKQASSRVYENEPKWSFALRPSFIQAIHQLDRLIGMLDKEPLWIEFDLETRAGHIACAGFSWSLVDAICIPFMCVESKEGYWRDTWEEAAVVWRIYKLLTHPNILLRGQNLLYDSQYTYRHWHFTPRVAQDTMISHHVAFAGLPKALDFQASMYCNHYVYWKDEGKNWDKSVGEEQLWAYNCVDCVRTRECGEAELKVIEQLGLQEVHKFQQQLFWPVLQSMNRGVLIDKKVRNEFAMELQEELSKRENLFQRVLGHSLNPRSPLQMQKLFYEDLKLPVIISRKTGQPTLDDDALTRLSAKEPIIRPLLKAISEYRSLGVFLSTFVQAELDYDGRMRCSFNICGTKTYRFSSSENAFGSGTNLQNLPKGTIAKEPEDLELPNVRKLFIPDPGFTFFDMDLDRADLQVVVWEAEDIELKQMLREGVDMHIENTKLLFGGASYTKESSERQVAKMWVHGCNYGGGPRTMAQNCGITVHQAEKMRDRWFQAHPGIKKWHERTEHQLRTRHYVENKFGYRFFFFDRIDGLLSEALAWQPQSTVACTINRAYLNIYNNLPEVWTLLQVHDSLAGQFPTHLKDWAVRRMKEEAQIVIPYDDPLIIPVNIKTSAVSWGACA